MRIGNLSGNHLHFRSFWRNELYKLRQHRNQEQEYYASCNIKNTVGNRRSFCILGLSDGRQQRCNGRSNIISQQDWDRSCQTNDTADTIRTRLGCEILQHRNGRRTALYHQGHRHTKQYA